MRPPPSTRIVQGFLPSLDNAKPPGGVDPISRQERRKILGRRRSRAARAWDNAEPKRRRPRHRPPKMVTHGCVLPRPDEPLSCGSIRRLYSTPPDDSKRPVSAKRLLYECRYVTAMRFLEHADMRDNEAIRGAGLPASSGFGLLCLKISRFVGQRLLQPGREVLNVICHIVGTGQRLSVWTALAPGQSHRAKHDGTEKQQTNRTGNFLPQSHSRPPSHS